MLPSKRLFLADEELGKKDDDHRPKTHPHQRWQPKSWKPPQRRRALLVSLIICPLYILFTNMPTNIPPGRDQLKSRLPPSQHVMPDTPLPPGSSESDPPPRGESDTSNEYDLYYEGELQFYNLKRTLKLFPEPWCKELFQRNSIRSRDLGYQKLDTVHFVLMGRDNVSIEGIQRVNGLDRVDCPVNWHDARVDYAQWSTDSRLERAIATVLTHIQAYLKPQALVTQRENMEENFSRGMRKTQDLQIPHIVLPHAAKELMWMAALDSDSLRVWNDVHVEFLIYAAPGSAGSLIRLIRSLEHADLLGLSPSLTIELPSRVDPELLRFLNKMHWPSNTSSKFTVRRRIQSHKMSPGEASVRAVEAYYPRNPDLSHVLVISPDTELAPSFYHYLMYTMLKHRHSIRPSMLPPKLMGISLELPSSGLTDVEPFKPPDIENTQFLNRNAPETLPLFLWQAPSSNAALYFGDKWAELHSFLGCRLAAEEAGAETPLDENVVSKRYPAFMELLLELLRVKGYYLLYPAFSEKGKFSLATFHNELFRLPEEFLDSSTEALQGSTSPERPLSQASTLMPLLEAFALELPDIALLPIISYNVEEMSDFVFSQHTEEYQRNFRARYGGCLGALRDYEMNADKLFCAE